MSTETTPLKRAAPDERLTDTIEYQIANLAAQGEALLESRSQLTELAAEEEKRTKSALLAETWKPVMEAIYAALPPWMHPYIEHPTRPLYFRANYGYDSDLQHTPVVLTLPDLAPIHIYLDNANKPHYEAAQAACGGDVDYGYYAYWHTQTRYGYWDIEGLPDSLAIAVALSAQSAPLYAEREAEAARRTDFANSVTPAPPKPRPSVVTADALVRIAEVLETMLEAGALERIAAALEILATDPPNVRASTLAESVSIFGS